MKSASSTNQADESMFYEDAYDLAEEETTCPHCDGTGGDPWNDFCTPCEFCDGEGYKWWL